MNRLFTLIALTSAASTFPAFGVFDIYHDDVFEHMRASLKEMRELQKEMDMALDNFLGQATAKSSRFSPKTNLKITVDEDNDNVIISIKGFDLGQKKTEDAINMEINNETLNVIIPEQYGTTELTIWPKHILVASRYEYQEEKEEAPKNAKESKEEKDKKPAKEAKAVRKHIETFGSQRFVELPSLVDLSNPAAIDAQPSVEKDNVQVLTIKLPKLHKTKRVTIKPTQKV